MNVELEMLRHFYDSWEALHAIEPGPFAKRRREQAAQTLVEASHAIKRFRDPDTLTAILHG